MGGGLRRHHPLDLALAEPLRMLREALGERVAHERRRRGAARLEAHPEPDEGAAHEGAPVARQDLPGVEHHAQVHAGPRALESQPLLDAQQDLADAEQPDDGDDEIEALHQLGDAEGQAQLAGHDVEPDGGEDEADQDRHERLERVAAAEPDETGEGEELDGEELRRPELERDLGEERARRT